MDIIIKVLSDFFNSTGIVHFDYRYLIMIVTGYILIFLSIKKNVVECVKSRNIKIIQIR